MRLIDADAFERSVMCSDAEDMQDVIYALRDYPTAYDPDKIVKQLNEEKEFSYADFDEYVNEVCPYLDEEYDDLFNNGLERAIEIVKGGGADAN